MSSFKYGKKKDDSKGSKPKGSPTKDGKSRANNSHKSFVKREQPRKDSNDPRINLDNMRTSDLAKLFTRKDSNHVEWDLRKDPESIKLAASLPFSSVPGRNNGLDNSIPGVMAITWMPTFGSPHANTLSALKESLYSYVVHANSRTKLYDPNDLLLMVLAVHEIFTKISEMKRVYGIMRDWRGSNEYTPTIIARALGFDYEDLRDNYPTMVDDLNLLIAETKQLWVPNVFTVLDRYVWMATNIFTDADSAKSQFIMYVRGMYFMYDETYAKTGGCLRPATYSNDPTISSEFDLNATAMDGGEINRLTNAKTLRWDQHITMLRNMINAIRNSSDRGMICGDILNAYGVDKILTMLPLTTDFTCVPAYNEEVMWQIENLTTYGNYPVGLYQNLDNNTLFTQYHFMMTENNATKPDLSLTKYSQPATDVTANKYNYAFSHALLNFHQTTNPTPEQIIVATRNITLGVEWAKFALPVDQGNTKFIAIYGMKPFTGGTTMATGYRMFKAVSKWDSNGHRLVRLPNSKNYTIDGVSGYNTQHTDIVDGAEHYKLNDSVSPTLLTWIAFDWAPHFLIKVNVGNETAIQLINAGGFDLQKTQVYAEYDLYQVIDKLTLSRIHDFCSYSEFDIPVM